MVSVQRLLKNTVASLITQISTPISSLILVLIIANKLGVEALGAFSSAFAFFFIFQSVSDIGLTYLITRDVSQRKDKAGEYFINGIVISFVTSTLMVAFMCLVARFTVDKLNTLHVIYLLSFSLVPATLNVVSQSICRAFEKLEYITIAQVTGNIARLGLGLSVLLIGLGLKMLMLMILISNTIMFVISIVFAIKIIGRKTNLLRKLSIKVSKTLIYASPVFMMILILSTVRWNIDVLILTKLLGEQQVGLYSAAYKIMNICKLGVSCYIMAVQPVIFRLFKTSIDEFIKVCNESLKFLFILILPITVGTMLLSERFVLLVFNSDFIESARALTVIIWILLFSGLNLILSNTLVASNKQKINMYANLTCMLGNIALNFILIPKIGFMGASIASLLSSIILFSFQYLHISKSLYKIDFIKLLLRPLMAVIVMGIFVKAFKEANLFIIIVTSAIIYATMLIAFKAVTIKEINSLLINMKLKKYAEK